MIAFIDRAPEFTIRDQVVHITLDDQELAMPLRVFRITLARAATATRRHDSAGEVVPFKPKRGRR
jgi:hypothetical protein